AGRVRAGRDEPFTVGRHHHGPGFLRMAAGQLTGDLARLYVPQPDGAVARGGEQVGAGHVGDRADVSRVRADFAEHFPGARVEADGERRAVRDGDGRSVSGEGKRRDGGTAETPQRLAGGDLPGGRAAGLVLRPEPGDKGAAIRGERDGPDRGRPG